MLKDIYESKCLIKWQIHLGENTYQENDCHLNPNSVNMFKVCVPGTGKPLANIWDVNHWIGLRRQIRFAELFGQENASRDQYYKTDFAVTQLTARFLCINWKLSEFETVHICCKGSIRITSNWQCKVAGTSWNHSSKSSSLLYYGKISFIVLVPAGWSRARRRIDFRKRIRENRSWMERLERSDLSNIFDKIADTNLIF